MKKCGIGWIAIMISVCLTFSEKISSALTAEEILARTIKVYAEAQTFSCDGEYIGIKVGDRSRHDRRTVAIRFQRPNLIRVDWTMIQLGGDPLINSIFTHEGKVYFAGEGMGCHEQESLAAAVNATTGISAGLSTTIPYLLLAYPRYFVFEKIEQLDDETIEDSACYKLSGTTSSGVTMEMLIDKKIFVLRRVKERFSISAESLRHWQEEFSRQHPEAGARYPSSLVDEVHEETTLYRNIRFNLPLDPGEIDNVAAIEQMCSVP